MSIEINAKVGQQSGGKKHALQIRRGKGSNGTEWEYRDNGEGERSGSGFSACGRRFGRSGEVLAADV
jgi:hypothetical protein